MAGRKPVARLLPVLGANVRRNNDLKGNSAADLIRCKFVTGIGHDQSGAEGDNGWLVQSYVSQPFADREILDLFYNGGQYRWFSTTSPWSF
jgi:hypothetical protein